MFSLRYGRGEIEFSVPPSTGVTVIRKPPMTALANPAESVAWALDHGVNSSPLAEIAGGARSACVAICDITRPVPNGLFLRPLIERLHDGGIPLDRITVLVATGLHRPNEGAELAELIGDPWVQKNCRVLNHFARNDAEHVDLGTTSTRGTVVKIDRRFVEADVRIATGLVEPHFMAGYSGGRKVIAPGLAHVETITTFHSARFMANPAAANCNLTGNPLHEEQLEIVRMIGGALAINTVINEDRQLAMINYGEILESHHQAVTYVREYCEVGVPQRFSTVVTSAAGYPLDKTYYQTVKGMVGAINVLKPGGDLIIASECEEGMGSREFVNAQRRLVQSGPNAFLEAISRKSHADIDEWQTQMQLLPMRIGNLYLYSDKLSRADRALTGVQCVDSLDQAVRDSLQRQEDPPSLAVIPEGPYVIPFHQA